MEDSIKGKRLRPEMAQRVSARYEAGFYDDAVFAAYKVVENKLREALGRRDGTAMELINQAFSPTKGVLQDPSALPGDRESVYFLFKGAFGLFRNPQGHGFPEVNEEQAFDQIVLANMLLEKIEHAIADRTLREKLDIAVPEIQWRGYPDAPHRFLLDTDNDGVEELVIASRDFHGTLFFRIYEIAGREVVVAPIEIDDEPIYPWPAEDIVLVDIDNDGENEIMAALGGDTTTALIFYKYRNARYEILRPPSTPRGTRSPVFVDAHLADFDDDGRLEIVSQEYGPVPDELWPKDIERSDRNWGRIREVWRWNPDHDQFELVRPRELLYVGGR